MAGIERRDPYVGNLCPLKEQPDGRNGAISKGVGQETLGESNECVPGATEPNLAQLLNTSETGIFCNVSLCAQDCQGNGKQDDSKLSDRYSVGDGLTVLHIVYCEKSSDMREKPNPVESILTLENLAPYAKPQPTKLRGVGIHHIYKGHEEWHNSEQAEGSVIPIGHQTKGSEAHDYL